MTYDYGKISQDVFDHQILSFFHTPGDWDRDQKLLEVIKRNHDYMLGEMKYIHRNIDCYRNGERKHIPPSVYVQISNHIKCSI